MNIPFYKKANPNDNSCAPVCLQMALAYYGINKPINEIYDACESIGDSHYTLPWGICLGAAKYSLRAYYISKRPFELYDDNRLDIMNITGLKYEQIVRIEKSQVERCDANNSINILIWDDGFEQLPFKILERRLGVVVPTLWWDHQPHYIVLTKYTTNGQNCIYYLDPNTENNSGERMSDSDFFDKWIHENTDNDLLIITSNKKGNDAKIAAQERMRTVSTAAATAAASAAAAYSTAVAAMAQFAQIPIVSSSKKIIWKNIFECYPIPKITNDLTTKDAKEWSLIILSRLKQDIPGIPLESSPDSEDIKTITNLIIKYKADPSQTWLEIDLLQKVVDKLYKANDNEIFFLLYRLIEK